MRLLTVLMLCMCLTGAPVVAGGGIADTSFTSTAPDAELAAGLLDAQGPVVVSRDDSGVPGWTVRAGGVIIGYLGSTWEIAGSVGYSGRPLDVLVAITPDARIKGARLMAHNEPVLTLGISDDDIAAYVNGFAGHDLAAPRVTLLASQAGLPDVIARATVSTGVIRDGILRSARTLAIGRGLLAATGGIDRIGFAPMDWPGLEAMGALTRSRASMADAARALIGAKVPIEPGDGAFLDLYAGLIDPPTVGQNLLGQQAFTRAIGALGPGETALLVASSGLHSHRGMAWKQTGVFDRIAIVQGETRHVPVEADYLMVKKIIAADTPDFKEISLFRLPATIDPLRPFRIEVRATRPTATGEAAMTITADYALPQGLRLAPPPEPEPLWRAIWAAKHVQTAIVAAMLAVLTLILFAQDSITRRPNLWRYGRVTFLAFTLLVLGWGLNGQLSVVQVVAFIHSLLTGFHWETFLIEPVIFLLWG
ncbi:MAG: protein NirI, partial [Paracoccaceae bacterium]|nr:protein NirI [Paracoccaceae bacterium]